MLGLQSLVCYQFVQVCVGEQLDEVWGQLNLSPRSVRNRLSVMPANSPCGHVANDGCTNNHQTDGGKETNLQTGRNEKRDAFLEVFLCNEAS